MATFDSRRRLSARELLPALAIGAGVGLGVGLVSAYLARIFLQRERLAPASAPRVQAPEADR